MIFFLIPILFFMSDGMQVSIEGFQSDYLSRNKTNTVKGIFVLLIFLSHASQYISFDGSYDAAYRILKKYLGQMVVSMFLFYSGYGMMEAIKQKGRSYIKAIPRNRFLAVLIPFDFAVLLYTVLYIAATHTIPSAKKLILSLIGYDSMMNSNWYIFIMLILYVLMFLCFTLTCRIQNSRVWQFVSLGLLSALSVLTVLVEEHAGLPARYYNTLLLFAAGCWYSFFRTQLERILQKSNYIYLLTLTVMLGAYFTAYEYRADRLLYHTVWGILFSLLIVLLTMKISISNAVLIWFGENVFSIYILQRIPMIILDSFGLSQSHRYVFVIMSFFLTLCIAIPFSSVTGKIAKKIRRQ